MVASLVAMLLFQQNWAHDDDSCWDLDSGKRRVTSFSHGSHLTTLKDDIIVFRLFTLGGLLITDSEPWDF